MASQRENTALSDNQILSGDGPTIQVPDDSFIRDAQISREGQDLLLQHGKQTLTIEGYYNHAEPPTLTSPSGLSLSPNLVDSFSQNPLRFASLDNDAVSGNPVGAVHELSGTATVTRTDGSTETIARGTPIYQGDIVETGSEGAVNIMFIDETSFAISEDARLAIDEFVFDPATNSGSTDFSVLKGVFVYTSGLVGREDPDDVQIETPVGSIGIRGTIIAGDVNNGEITVVEGAIVLSDYNGNQVTLANQYETARFNTENGGIDNLGQASATDVATKFAGVSTVAPDLFSSINDTAGEAEEDGTTEQQNADTEGEERTSEGDSQNNEDGETAAEETQAQGESEQGETQQDQEQDQQTEESQAEAEGQSDPESTTQGESQSDSSTEQAPDGTQPANETQGQGQQQPSQSQQTPQQTGDSFGANAGQSIGENALSQSLGTNQGTVGQGQPAPGTAPPSAAATNTRPADTTKQPDPSTYRDGLDTDDSPNNTNNDGTTNDGTTGDNGTTGFTPAVDLNTIAENTNGGTVATISGDANNTISSLNLLGVAGNYFEANETTTGSGQWIIKAKSDINFDYEHYNNHPITLHYGYTVGSASQMETDQLTVQVSDVNETIEQARSGYINQTMHLLSGDTMYYDFSRDFFDPENADMTYSIGNIYVEIDADNDNSTSGTIINTIEDSLGIDYDEDGFLGTNLGDYSESTTLTSLNSLISYIDSWSLDANTGVINIIFKQAPEMSYDLTLNMDIIATDGSESLAQTYTIKFTDLDFGSNDWSLDGTAKDTTLTTSHLKYAGTNYGDTIIFDTSSDHLFYQAGDGTNFFTVDSGNHTIMGGVGVDDISINNGDNNTILTRGGDDIIYIDSSAGNNDVKTGSGNDAVTILGGAAGNNIIDTGVGADTITLDSTQAKYNAVMAGADNDTISIINYASDNNIHGGQGNDVFDVQAGARNTLRGGEGDDSFTIQGGADNQYFGDGGNDTFKFDVTANSDLLSTELIDDSYTRTFDGGSGFDTIALVGDGASAIDQKLDFTNINIGDGASTQFRSIEKIDLTDTYDHEVILKTSDVFEMTNDGNRTLIIDGNDTNQDDRFHFTNDSTLGFTKTQSGIEIDKDGDETVDSGDTFDVYFNGEVTLMIDQDVQVNSGDLPV